MKVLCNPLRYQVVVSCFNWPIFLIWASYQVSSEKIAIKSPCISLVLQALSIIRSLKRLRVWYWGTTVMKYINHCRQPYLILQHPANSCLKRVVQRLSWKRFCAIYYSIFFYCEFFPRGVFKVWMLNIQLINNVFLNITKLLSQTMPIYIDSAFKMLFLRCCKKAYLPEF